MAGIIVYQSPIKSASGKILGKKEAFVSVTRSFGKKQNGCAASSKRNLVTHPYSTEELQAQAAFRTNRALAATARLDPDNEYNWRQRWADARDNYPTFNGYLVAQAFAGHINTDGTYKA